jgi:hypothetical protein
MSRAGKIAWYWNALNARALALIEEFPKEHWCVLRLEDLKYEKYLELAAFLGLKTETRQGDYERIAKRRPNKYEDVPTIATWKEQEIEEFQQQVAPMAERLGYPWRFDELPIRKRAPRSRIGEWRRRLGQIIPHRSGRKT